METQKMKKLMIIAALGTAALFTACGDDSSSSPAPSQGCSVTATENSVTQTIVFGEVETKTWTIDGDKITITYSDPEEEPYTYNNYNSTIESLKAEAEESCAETLEIWKAMGL